MKTPLAGIAAVALSLIVAVPPAGAAGGPNHPAKVTGHVAASLHDIVYLRAGSTTHLVYVTQRAVAGGSYLGGEPSPARLMARSRSGKTVQFGRLPYPTHDGAMSTVGDRVVAIHDPGDIGRRVDVWSIVTRRHRVIRLPRSTTEVAATTHGFVFAHGSKVFEWVARTGSFRSRGTPFAGKDVTSLVTDNRHLVVTGQARGAKAMSFKRPGRYHKLHTAGVNDLVCQQVNHGGALCVSINRVPNTDVEFVPLDGAAATRVDGAEYVQGYALAGANVIWMDDTDHAAEHLQGFRAGVPVVTRSTRLVARLPGIVGAFGSAFVASRPGQFGDIDTVLAAASPLNISTAFVIPRSTETAGAFALAPHRLAYVSDARNRDDPRQELGVRSVAVDDRGDHVATGTPRDLAGRDGDQQVVVIGTDRPVDATDTITAFLRINSDGTTNAFLRTPTETISLPHSMAYAGLLQVVGHLALWGTPPAEYDPDGLYLYDVDTGDTEQVLQGTRARSVALTTTDLFYGTDTGEVRRYDLDTGSTTTIYTTGSSGEYDISVYARGGWVAWTEAPLGHSRQAVGRLQDVENHGPVITLPHPAYGVTDAGVLMEENSGESYRCCYRVPPQHVSTWFQPFGGELQTLLSDRRLSADGLPQLTGHVLAWIDQFGDLRVKRYSY